MATPAKQRPVASYAVKVNGTALDQKVLDLVSGFKVTCALGVPDVCTFSILDKELTYTDGDQFAVGNDLEVLLGARTASAPSVVFKGQIASLEPEFKRGGTRLSIRAYDKSHKLHSVRQSRVFANVTPSDAIKKILSEAGLSAVVPSFGAQSKHLQQSNETDWDFVQRQMKQHGYEFLVDGPKLKFKKLDESEGAPIELKYQENLISFHPRLSGMQQPNTVTSAAYDPKTRSTFAASAASGKVSSKVGVAQSKMQKALGTSKIHLITPVESQGEAKGLAQAVMDELSENYLQAEGVADGDARLKPGVKIKIVGVGSRFSGEYVITSATHSQGGGKAYEVTFQTGRAGRTTLTNLISATAKSFSDQIVIGIVTNNNDPDKLGRVKVKFPQLGDQIESAWARVTTPSSGKGRGIMMIPQVNEEVVVAFEQGDTRRPFVLGSLYNGKTPPGDKMAYKDGSFALKSDKAMHLHSKGLMEVVVGGNSKFITSGKHFWDVDGDTKFTHKGGIAWDVTGAAKMETKNSIEFNAMNSVKVGAKAGITMESMANFSLKGTAGVSVETSGVLTLKGSMINIG